MCCRSLKNGRWRLITPGTNKGKYTMLRLGTNRHQLHRLIAEVFLNAGKPLTSKQDVDHREQVDGSHWQDRLSNLRICNRSENARNRQLSSRNTSGYKGAYWDKRAGEWLAQITVSGKVRYLGYFASPEDAARAYDRAAVTCFGEFACTNTSLGILKPLV